MQAAAGILINARTATNNALIVKGATSQTANLQEWQDSAGAVLSRITSVGYVYSPYMEVPITNSGLPGIVIKGASGQTADLQRWQNSAGTVLAAVTSAGNITTTGAVSINTAGTGTLNLGDGAISKGPGAGFSFNSGISISFLGTGGASATTLIPLFVAFQSATAKTVIRGAASQTANLQEWQNSAGTVLASVTPNGSVTAAYFGSSVGSTSYIQPNLTSGAIGILTAGNANVGLMVRGNSAQTANLQEWQNSGGTVLTKVDASGNITAASIVKTGGTSAQYLMADGSVTTSGGGGGSAADSDQNILAIQVFG
jgi:hypothetical protein